MNINKTPRPPLALCHFQVEDNDVMVGIEVPAHMLATHIKVWADEESTYACSMCGNELPPGFAHLDNDCVEFFALWPDWA